jgi:hypothetical protein
LQPALFLFLSYIDLEGTRPTCQAKLFIIAACKGIVIIRAKASVVIVVETEIVVTPGIVIVEIGIIVRP